MSSDDEKVFVVKNATDLQRLKLEKLMKNPEKPVFIPEKTKDKKFPQAPEFVRNVMGSSAGAGSGEFHVYRHIRRREYARQLFLNQLSEKEKLDLEYHDKLEANTRLTEKRAAKKRGKRQRAKQRLREKRRKGAAGEVAKEASEESSEEEGEESGDVRVAGADVTPSGADKTADAGVGRAGAADKDGDAAVQSSTATPPQSLSQSERGKTEDMCEENPNQDDVQHMDTDVIVKEVQEKGSEEESLNKTTDEIVNR